MDRIPGKHNVAKIIALIMAAILWIYVMNEQNPPTETSIEVPLEVRNLSSNYVAMDVPGQIRIKVRAVRTLIYGIRSHDIQAYVDLKNAPEGKYTAQVNTVLPPGFELVEVNPDKVTINLDPISSKKMPVEVRLSGAITTGMVVGKVAVDTEQVTVQGPKSLLNAVEKLVANVDISEKYADFTAEVPLTAYNRDNKKQEGITLNPTNVKVSVTLAQSVTKKTVDVKPILSGELGTGIVLQSITCEPAKIEISGDPQVLGRIDFVYTEPINMAGIDKNISKVVKLQLGENVAAQQNTVTVHIVVGTNPAIPLPPKP
ncbi:putative membrane protein [Propionispora sp. 2/2-37]|uniref:CdaR family protein n=1 Tax=Propionispora sp. 2/2-37 TaxID=1677858 RepID=UPI0006BB58B4|nr:CdaR family protein [Propionispora sp. 2/2-37]CUH95201.1 putative membrane protein [Propionispora sp. 2/2-37]